MYSVLPAHHSIASGTMQIVEQADLMEAIKYPLSNWNNYHNNMIRGAYHNHREILMPIINSIIDGISISSVS